MAIAKQTSIDLAQIGNVASDPHSGAVFEELNALIRSQRNQKSPGRNGPGT